MFALLLSGAVELDAVADRGVESFVLSGRFVLSVLDALFQPVAARLTAFRLAFLSHHALRLNFERELLEQPLYTLKPLITLDR